MENNEIKREEQISKENFEETQTLEISAAERLKSLAEKKGQTVEELLLDLESKQTTEENNAVAENQSTGSLGKNEQSSFDPASTEFLKGIWGK